MFLSTGFSARRLALLATVVTVGVATTACTSSDPDETSLTEIAGTVAIDDSLVVAYFNAERYADGAEIEWRGDNETLPATVFLENRAEFTVSEPFVTPLRLSRSEVAPIDLADVDVMYGTWIGGGGTSLVLGDFDPAEVEERLTALASDGGAIGERVADRSRDVTAERYVELSDDDEPNDVLGVDESQTAVGLDGFDELATALDDADVYAAIVFTDGTPDDLEFGGETSLAVGWDLAGFATGFVEGEEHATMALWHADEDDAAANGNAAEGVMFEHANCLEGSEVDVEVDGRLTVATCPIEEAGWAMRLIQRYPMVPGIFGS